MTDKDKKIFIKFGLWLGFLLLIIIIGISKTHALTINELRMYYTDYNGNTYTDNSTASAQWGAYYTTYINHNFGGGIMFDQPGTLYAFFNSGQGCSNKNCILTGQLVAKTDSSYSNNTLSSVRIQLEQSGTYKNCSVIGTSMEYNTYSYLTFQCASYNLNSGFNLVFSQFSAPSTTFIKYGIPVNDYTLQETATTDDVIVNDNKNTQSIINNNNTNTQNIIDNQNQNTQDMINSQQVCTNKIIDKEDIVLDNKYLSSSGLLNNNDSYGVTDYIPVDKIVRVISQGHSTINTCFYDEDKTLISCVNGRDLSTSIPSNTKYLRMTIYKVDSTPKIEVEFCQNGNQALAEQNEEAETTRKGIFKRLGELISTLFSNDDADISGLDNMVGWLPAGPLDSIINLPLNLFNSLTNVLSGTCNSVSLTLPFVEEQLILPCFDTFMSQYLTGFSTIWTFIGVTVSVFILYNYLLTLYKWVDDTLTMRENNLPGYYDDNWGGGA